MTTAPSERARVVAAYVIADRVVASLAESIDELSLWTFDEDQIEHLSREDRKALDAFLKRFENVVEAGRRLFRAALAQGGEEQRNLATGEIAIRMEQLELIDSAERWARIVSARNAAMHDYALETDEAAEVLPRAYAAAIEATEIVASLLARLRRRFPPADVGETP